MCVWAFLGGSSLGGGENRLVKKVADFGIEVNTVESVKEKEFCADIEAKADGGRKVIVKFADGVRHLIEDRIGIRVHHSEIGLAMDVPKC
jgi:hypothetical protein